MPASAVVTVPWVCEGQTITCIIRGPLHAIVNVYICANLSTGSSLVSLVRLQYFLRDARDLLADGVSFGGGGRKPVRSCDSSVTDRPITDRSRLVRDEGIGTPASWHHIQTNTICCSQGEVTYCSFEKIILMPSFSFWERESVSYCTVTPPLPQHWPCQNSKLLRILICPLTILKFLIRLGVLLGVPLGA